MKTRLKQLFAGLALALGLVALPVVPLAAVSVDPLNNVCSGTAPSSSAVCDSQDDNISDVVKTVVDILLFLVGIIAVVMIIVGGIMYATSAGDSGRVTTAKNTLMYAIIGLLVAVLAYAIVHWVTDRF